MTMYSFKNTTPTGISAGVTIPAEAMKFNGKYLENEIPGYRTLSVSGRELLTTTVKSTEIGNADGVHYDRKKYEPRTITVKYQLIAKSNKAFREAFNKLNELLAVAQAKIIFRDEPDKFFIGTKQGNTEIEAGSNSVIGKIEIFCADPFKYSVKVYSAKPKLDKGHTIAVDYRGTRISHPTFKFNFKSDNGYIGMTNQKGKILEFGNISEVDGAKQNNEQLVTLNNFFNAKNDTTGTDYMHPHYGAKGTLTKKKWFATNFLTLGTPGTKVGDANGGLRTVTVPADSTGSTVCKNFYAYFHLVFYAGLMGQTGEMCVNFLTSDNKLICGVNWAKTDETGNTGFYEMIGYNPNKKASDKQAGTVLNKIYYTTSHIQSQNPWYWNWGHCDLLKEGSKLTFYYNGGYYKYNIPSIKDMSCRKIQIAIKQWGNRGSSKYLTYSGFDKFYFRKIMKEHWVDSDNMFGNGDTLEIKTETMRSELNGIQKASLGKLANDWEDFALSPGKNQIKIYWSSFCKNLDITMYYREVFL